MPGEEQPFWRRPMRVMDLALEDSHGSWLDRWTAERIVDVATRIHANVINVMAVNEWGQAYWPSPDLPMHPELRGEDRLARIVERARGAGLHISVMWGPTAAPMQAERHPDWASRKRDGSRLGWGFRPAENCWMLCMNSPYEDLVNRVADQLFRDYEIDLLALDFYHQEPCWCTYCRQRCLDDTGIDIFAERMPYGREDTHREWQDERVRAQILRIHQTISRYGGALAHYRVVPGTDIIFNEPHTGDMLELRDKGYLIRRQRADARATGKADVICTPYGHGYYVGWSKPDAHMRQEFRTIGAHGSNPWPVMWDWEILRDPRGLEPLGTAFAEMASISELMGRAEPMGHVALVMSPQPLAGREAGPVAGHEHGDALKGFYDALSRAHVPFDLVRQDMIVPERLERCTTLVLANVTCLSDEQINTIRQFVADGGHLVATYESSRYTAEGWNRHEFGLSDVMGVRYLSAFETPWCYVVPCEVHPIVAHLGEGLGVPHGDIWALRRELAGAGGELSVFEELKAGRARDTGRHLKVEADGSAHVIARVHDTRKPRGSYFIKDIVPPIPGRDTGYPSIVIHPFGRGVSVYFAGQPDRLFQRQGHPDYEAMLVNTVKWLSGEPAVRVEAPATVEATYWTLDDGDHLVHLLNHTHDAMFPAPATGEKVPASREVFRPIREVVPVRPVRIHVAGDLRSAEVLVGGGRVHSEGGTLTLDGLDEYAVIRIKR